MKLIVDIPDHLYNIIRNHKYITKHTFVKAVANGIPLIDILDKINGMYRVILKGTPKDDWAVRWNDCLDEVLEIIDKYTAAESEDRNE